MRQMPAGSFKARCLAVMAEVQATREPVLVTKRGKPLVKVVPLDGQADNLFGYMKGKAKIVGDIESPLPVKWKALKA